MEHIFSSSIGKKLVMSLSGMFLMIFLIIHAGANALALFGREMYNEVCHFMDTNPVIQVMVPVLALGFVIHILYAVWLTWSNLKARGVQAYAVGTKTQASSWAARNMFVLGLIVVGFLALHLYHFWAKMQLQHFIGGHASDDPYSLVAALFRQPLYVAIYLIWIGALWLHLRHGFWSALQTIGLNNSKWLARLQTIAMIYASVIALVFAAVPLFFLLGLDGGN
ncbi:MAG: succinate dehydrogenase cytochrome b subunit [Prevotellaceae bacterium]|jgi:succinate dehydrogenase / fumarate reductase cytochrome b subunit|nr:succinate dehydrogenase cytochrome b subunit [Prevotellaceae bacterium]